MEPTLVFWIVVGVIATIYILSAIGLISNNVKIDELRAEFPETESTLHQVDVENELSQLEEARQRLQESKTLLELLRYSKKPDLELSLEEVMAVLEPHYGYHLRALNVFRIVFDNWWLVINEPLFRTGYTVDEKVYKLLYEPFEKTWGLSAASYPDDAPKTIEDVMKVQLFHMLVQMRLTNIGWCRDLLYPEENQSQDLSTG